MKGRKRKIDKNLVDKIEPFFQSLLNSPISFFPKTSKLLTENSIVIKYGLKLFFNKELRENFVNASTKSQLEKLIGLVIVKEEGANGFGLLTQLKDEFDNYEVNLIKKEILTHALFRAIENLDIEHVKLALELGADPNALREGKTPFKLILEKEFPKSPALQISMSAVGQNQTDLLDEFREFAKKKEQIIYLLKEYGAKH